MREQWRYVYVGLMIPFCSSHSDASPVAVLMFCSSYLLYRRIALALRSLRHCARDGKAALKWDEDYEQHEMDKSNGPLLIWECCYDSSCYRGKRRSAAECSPSV